MKLTNILLIGINIVLIVVVLKLLSADMHAKSSERAVRGLDFESALEHANKAVSLNPNEPYYYRQRAKALLLLAAQDDKSAEYLKTEALADLQQAYALNPSNLATIRNSIPYYSFLARQTLSMPEAESTKARLDPKFADITRTFFVDTKQTFPTDAGVVATLAKYEKVLGMTKEYEQSISILSQLRPDLLEWYEGIAY